MKKVFAQYYSILNFMLKKRVHNCGGITVKKKHRIILCQVRRKTMK